MKRLLIIHAIITLAAGLVLIVAPDSIPKTVGILVKPDEYPLCYFLGAAELAIAYLSFYSSKISDVQALRIIAASFIVFHAATGVLEVYALLKGLSPKIMANVMLRVAAVVLFYYYGIYKNRRPMDI